MILYVLLNLATEIIDSAEIGCTITGQPHDVNILLQGLLGFAACSDKHKTGPWVSYGDDSCWCLLLYKPRAGN